MELLPKHKMTGATYVGLAVMMTIIYFSRHPESLVPFWPF
jgi:hypothetical protein